MSGKTTSVYLNEYRTAVLTALAVERGCSIKDLMLEALDMFFVTQGVDTYEQFKETEFENKKIKLEKELAEFRAGTLKLFTHPTDGNSETKRKLAALEAGVIKSLGDPVPADFVVPSDFVM